MSERATSEFTPKLEDAFPDKKPAKKGREGELFCIKAYKELGEYTVVDYGDDELRQGQGIDISVQKDGWRRAYTIDVKNNMKDDGTIVVEADFFAPRKINDRVMHCNPQTGNIVFYDRSEMGGYLNRINAFEHSSLIEISKADRPTFVRTMFTKPVKATVVVDPTWGYLENS